MPDLTIIIVSYNTKEILKDCLTSLFKHTPLNLEVIVVDNASSDGSPQMVKKYFPKVKLIVNKQNKGFGGANNQAAKIAQADYILFLNSDTLIHDTAIADTLRFAQNQKNLSAVSCQLNDKDGSLQPSGGFFPNLFNLLTWQLFLDDLPILGNLLNLLIPPVHPKTSFYRCSASLDWVTGAFMLIPKAVYTQVHGFDEKIFMYAEELELCYRFKKLGYTAFYYSEAAITHLGGQSAGSELALPSEIKGIKYFFKKHFPSWQLPLVSLLFWLGSLLRYLVFGIILGDVRKAKTYRSALSTSLQS